MPCHLSECDVDEEAKRFGVALVGIYMYHFLWDSFILTPLVDWLVTNKHVAKDKRDKMRESLWKNAAVGTFSLFGLYIAYDQPWWMNPKMYFADWPHEMPDIFRWYYFIYLAFWLQSIDFMLNLTNKHYLVKRKDNVEMLIHHFVTIMLILFSFAFDLTRMGMCVLMIHEVNDLLLETGKLCVYLGWELVANVCLGVFAVAWFIVRLGFYGHNILWSCYTLAYDDIVVKIEQKGSYAGYDANTWWWIWQISTAFLGTLFVLHVFWGGLIIKMVVKTFQDGNIEKDIRSDSEAEDEIEVDEKPVATNTSANGGPAALRHRAQKAT